MNLGIFKMSLQSLTYNKLRSILTTLGIIIGTAIVIIVLSVGAGIEHLVLSQMESLTPETLFIEIQIPAKGSTMQKAMKTAEAIGTGVEITTMKMKDVEDIRELPNIEAAYAMTIGQAKMTYGTNERTGMIFAVSEDYSWLESVEMESGRFYNEEEDRAQAQVIVLGATIKEKLFEKQEALGENVKINGQNYKVIGVAQELGIKWFMNMDELVYIPVRTTQRKIMGIDHIMAIGMQMYDARLIDQTISQIEKLMRKNHNITDPDKDDFAVRKRDESMEILSSVTNAISYLLFAIAFISLVVGGVGIMNVMYVAVTERTNEIGLKKAVGAKPYAIRMQFLSESVVISAMGGIMGVGLGILVSWSVSYIANLLEFDWPFVITIPIITFAFIISVTLGIIFGYSPAQKAANMSPVKALRS